jgi:hypothetical protein
VCERSLEKHYRIATAKDLLDTIKELDIIDLILIDSVIRLGITRVPIRK